MRTLIAKLNQNGGFIFLAALAVALQIQVSLFTHEGYLGLRINLADILLPFSGLFILFSLVTKRSHWPEWHMKRMWWWLSVLLAVMSLSLLNGYLNVGYWSSWAVVNKYAGFIILLCYFLLGSWVATNSSQGKPDITNFVQVFCGFCLLILSVSFLSTLLQPIMPFPLSLGKFPWDGFMDNRNAFMVLTICCMVFIEAYRVYNKPVLPAWAYSAFWIMIPTFTIYNASRVGWIVGVVVLLSLLIKAPLHALKKIAPYLLVGCLIAYAAYLSASHPLVKKGQMLQYLVDSVQQEEVVYSGDKSRLISLEDGVELYKNSNPLWGAGLGGYQSFQKEKRGSFVDIIDSSPLWLLVETGAIGLLVFAGFFLSLLFFLYKKLSRKDDPFYEAAFFSLVLIIVMSCVHELLYTRFLWFFLGAATAVAKPK